MLRDVFYFGNKPNSHPREQHARDLAHARSLSTTEHFWVINEHCDYRNFNWDFDFDFLPDEDTWAREFNNAWPSQYDKDSGTWLCTKEPAELFVYRSEVDPIYLKNQRWKIYTPVDLVHFDMTWTPDPHEPPYIYTWGNKWVQGEVEPSVEYHCDNATERKYISNDVKVFPQWDRWKEYVKVNRKSFDFSWRPDPTSPPYIYVWGNKYESAEVKPTIEYCIPGATERKYMGDAAVEPQWDRWKEYVKVNRKSFDFSWRPDPHEPPYIYVWGNKYESAEVKPTLEYYVLGATEKKYMGDAAVEPQWDRWKEYVKVNRKSFDFSWRPDPHEPPYIYVWGNKYESAEVKPTVEYCIPKATERKYMGDAAVEPQWDRWKENIPVESFDYTWRPDPLEPPFIYVFGNKWNDATVESTLEYHVPGATTRKYINELVAITKPQTDRWSNMNEESFDYSWRPNPYSDPQIYQWEDGGPCYTVPNSEEVVFMEYSVDNRILGVKRYYITTTLEDLAVEHPDEVFWALNPDLNYDKFDFNWKPDRENFRHINTFGNEYSKNTQTYFVNGPMYKLGHTEFNYVEVAIQVESNLSMFYVDRGLGRDRFNALKERYPQMQRTRYLNSWVETIQRCCNKSDTKLFWVLNSEIDYSEFNFDFYPSPWQMTMVHVFGTQWSHWGNTYLVNKETFEESTKYVKVIEHINILNFVKSKRTKAIEKLYPTVVIDHGNSHSMTGDHMVKYDTSYLKTFKQMMNMLPDVREQYVWIISSICDYSNFDFTYICDPYAKEQLHVFPSNKEKFGDTFLVNVNKFRTLIDGLNKLEDYDKINFNNHQNVTRLPCPVIHVEDDTHCTAITTDFEFPYAIFQTEETYNAGTRDINLWEPETKSILVTSTGASCIVVPKEVKSFVKKELYDYPYIKVQDKLSHSKPLDIVFFSNGEACADENYEHLLFLTAGLGNKVIRVNGVQGRVASQHAAANSSDTPWYFLVNAKLKVNQQFDFDWQPDRLQIPKHYIFRATNPVNGLEYGHMAMVANNKKLTLNTNPVGLDFTMDSEHQIVNINSGVAMYNSSAWDTWRTAFRETLKLKYYNEHNHDLEAKFRLSSWLNLGDGEYGEYSTMGALDACRYYETVNGDFDQLRNSYDWIWLHEHFEKTTQKVL